MNMPYAKQIVDLLAVRHSKDVFVAECKDGPTWNNSYMRMDAWAMKRSWANPCTWGYEIKVSRSDFTGDQKWMGYLPLCNQLSFVCPTGLIDPKEVGDSVGLIWVSRTGTRLYNKKKAPHRDIEIPQELLIYILMCRSQIVGPNHYGAREGRDYWAAWLNQKGKDQELGHAVSYKISKIVKKAKARAKDAVSRVEEYKKLEAFLDSIGVKHRFSGYLLSSTKSRIERLRAAVPPDLEIAANNLSRSICGFRTELDKLKAEEVAQ